MTSNKYIASCNEEYWSDDTEFDTREEAFEYGQEEYGEGSNVFTGVKSQYIVNVGDAQEFMAEYMERSCEEDGRGEWSEEWENGWEKKTKMLELINQKLREIDEIIMKHHEPEFYAVTDVQ